MPPRNFHKRMYLLGPATCHIILPPPKKKYQLVAALVITLQTLLSQTLTILYWVKSKFCCNQALTQFPLKVSLIVRLGVQQQSLEKYRPFLSMALAGEGLTVACRSLVMPGATAWLDAPLSKSSIEQWRMVVIVTEYTLFVTSQYDAIFTFANQCIFRKVGAAARGAVKEFRAMETYKKQKNRYQSRLLLFINNVDHKNHNRIIENQSEFSGCPNSCNKFVTSRSW